jgi:SAM-dependent methyltransferase
VTVTYKPTPEVHSLRGAVSGFRYLTAYGPFQSVLDVGAGPGTWMSAARLAGVQIVKGVDISKSAPDDDILRECTYDILDVSQPFDLCRRFDCVICLEVAEHLEEQSAITLVSSLCRHGDLIFFSAAGPGQFGQNHINCQWPNYWQRLFNAEGFRCIDDVRWRMWTDHDVEPWYRQNMFRAVRDSLAAGSEPRIPSVVHPEMMNLPLEPNADHQAESPAHGLGLLRSVKAVIGRLTAALR